MLSYRRAILTASLVLTLFFMFFGGSKNIQTKNLLQGAYREQQLSTQDTNEALKEAQNTAHQQSEKQDQKLQSLEQERRILDKHLLELKKLPFGTSVGTQLAHQFPYESESRFPAYIWQTWKQSRDDPTFDSRFRDAIRSWEDKNPGFVHEVMTDETANAIVQHLYMNVPSVIEAYQAMPENILRADFFRYLILLARGGTYSDVDTQALKPVPKWIPDSISPNNIGLIVGIEADPDREDWAEWYARRIQFCQWTIQSKPGHPILRNIVANITDETLSRKHSKTLDLPHTKERGSQIMDWTGPGLWTDLVFGYFNDRVKSGLHDPVTWHNFTNLNEPYQLSDVMVLPITSFSPGVETMGAQSEFHPLAFVKHQFRGSWKPENERM